MGWMGGSAESEQGKVLSKVRGQEEVGISTLGSNMYVYESKEGKAT